MERAKSKGRYMKYGKKKLIPFTKLSEGINRRFLISVNDNLFKLPDMTETIRDEYITKYSRIDMNLRFLSPIYFASAIAFLHDNPEGPNEENFNDDSVKKYVSRLILESPSTLTQSTLDLRRKIEFLRYIRLLIKINSLLLEM
jgi:hypothetical protein